MEELVRLAKDEGLGFEYDITQTYYSYPMLSAQGGYVFKSTDDGLDLKIMVMDLIHQI